jgi:hypothetical protein
MRRVVQIISTKRSAHHAFVHWYCRNSRRPITFFNNITLSAPPRLRERETFDGSAPSVRVKGGNYEPDLLAGSTDVVMNIEGKSPASIRRWTDGYLRARVPGQLRRVVFLRDPVNTLASLAKRCHPRSPRKLFGYFYQVLAMQQTIGQLPDERAEFCDKVVLMTPWLRDPLYRDELAGYLDLNPGAPPAQVTRQGGGSSFNGRAYDPAADGAALHRRWQELERDSLFLAPFADEPSVAAMRDYFRLFGAQEPFDPTTIDILQQRAAKDRAAKDHVRQILIPLRRAAYALDAMERAPHQLARLLWRTVAYSRVMLRL